jgi:hypothetical protein
MDLILPWPSPSQNKPEVDVSVDMDFTSNGGRCDAAPSVPSQGWSLGLDTGLFSNGLEAFSSVFGLTSPTDKKRAPNPTGMSTASTVPGSPTTGGRLSSRTVGRAAFTNTKRMNSNIEVINENNEL